MSINVGYLGPVGSFTYLACKELFDPVNADHDFLFDSKNEKGKTLDIGKILDELAAKRIQLAVLPAINSAEGLVRATINALLEKPELYEAGVRVLGAITIPVSFSLLRKPGAIGGIKEIQSNSVALMQCHKGLDDLGLKKIPRVPVESNSLAALHASKDEDIAAVAPDICARLYNLSIIKPNLQGALPNYTRFYLLGINDGERRYFAGGRMLITIKGFQRNMQFFMDILRRYGYILGDIYSKVDDPAQWVNTYFFEIDGTEEEVRFQHLQTTLNKYGISWRVLGSYPSDIDLLRISLDAIIPRDMKEIPEEAREIEALGISDYKVFSHGPVRTVQDVLDHLFIYPEQIVKTLMYMCDNKPVFVSVPGNMEVDPEKLEAVVGTPPELARKEEISALGFQIGALSPLSVAGCRQVFDKRIFELEYVYCGYKHNSLSIRLRSTELENIGQIEVKDVVSSVRPHN